MQSTPKGMRVHIGIFGKRNVGKSSILNALVDQDISIVSETAGTTTDVVEKSMELLPLGPVVFVDTAGIDDEGALGQQRVEKTKKVIDRIDLAIIVSDERGFDNFEENLIKEFETRKTPIIFVENKVDKGLPSCPHALLSSDTVHTSALNKTGIDDLKQAIIKNVPDEYFTDISIASDLLKAGETAVLVVPIDLEAPKGRLILPQVQTIRDLLDNDSIAIVTKERELKQTLDNLKNPPALVITDSQAFLKVSADVPKNIK